MEILSAEFVVSNTKVEKCPQDNLPEYAFIGRSNVGKSSLINMLTKRPKLAMTSSTPRVMDTVLTISYLSSRVSIRFTRWNMGLSPQTRLSRFLGNRKL